MDREFLLNASLSEFVEMAGESASLWCWWFSGNRDIRASSLVKPAERLGMTPGELLDLILERRHRQVERKKKALEAQIESAEKKIEKLVRRKRDRKGKPEGMSH